MTQRLDGLRLLVVDDDGEVRDALALLLARRGAVVDVAADTKQARACLERAVPHAIVCDLGLPGEDGPTFVRWLRASDTPSRGVPVVACSASIHEAPDEFDACVAKTVGVDELAAVIRRLST